MAILERPRRGLRRRLTLGLALLATLGATGGWWAESAAPGPLAAAGRPVLAEVINASGRQGLARLVTRLLRERGLDVVYFGSDGKIIDSTVVLVRRGELARGQEVARILGHAKVILAIDTLLRLDVTIRLGRDYRLPPGRFPL